MGPVIFRIKFIIAAINDTILRRRCAIIDSIMTEAKKNPFINNKKEDYLQTHEKSQRDAIKNK